METILPLIIQAVTGAAAGGGIAGAIKQVALNKGMAAILGAVGGVGAGVLGPDIGGMFAGAGVPDVATEGTNLSALVGDAVGGAVGGGVLSGVVGAVMGAMNKDR